MIDPGAPRPRGRHSSPDGGRSVPASWHPPTPPEGAYGRGAWADDTPAWQPEPRAPRYTADDSWDDDSAPGSRVRTRRSDTLAGASTGSRRRASDLLDSDETGPVPVEWRHRGGTGADDDGRHPSAPLPPPPASAWSRLSHRADPADDAPTQAQRAVSARRPPVPVDDEADDATDAHHLDPRAWEDQTGGLEVIGANVVDDHPRRGRWRRRRAAARPAAHDDLHDDDLHGDDLHDDDLHDDDLHDDDLDDEVLLDDDAHDEDLHDEVLLDDHDDGHGEIPLKPYDRRTGRRRRRRRPVAVLVALVVLGALVLGIVVGGQKLLGLFTAADYTGQGTGTVSIRVQSGDTLSDIGRTLVNADVVASVGPFVNAAEANPDAMGITAGVYQMRKQMSGAAALDLLLDPSSRLVSRVTIPEGLTMANTLQRIADATNMPIADLQAAASNPAALGLPTYANGSLEGFLFPATYDVEPGDTPADVLKGMVTRTLQALDTLGVPEDQRLTVLTKASLVQAEASTTDDMAKVARVLENRLAIGMPLQLDTTVNYANGKSGITTTTEDRQNPSPYNTYLHAGLPPGPIGNPGEDAIRAVLNPAPGDWLFFVVVNPESGETRFAVTAEEHQANVAIFQQWLRDHPGG